jgi:hypothetical protein
MPEKRAPMVFHIRFEQEDLPAFRTKVNLVELFRLAYMGYYQ